MNDDVEACRYVQKLLIDPPCIIGEFELDLLEILTKSGELEDDMAERYAYGVLNMATIDSAKDIIDTAPRFVKFVTEHLTGDEMSEWAMLLLQAYIAPNINTKWKEWCEKLFDTNQLWQDLVKNTREYLHFLQHRLETENCHDLQERINQLDRSNMQTANLGLKHRHVRFMRKLARECGEYKAGSGC